MHNRRHKGAGDEKSFQHSFTLLAAVLGGNGKWKWFSMST